MVLEGYKIRLSSIASVFWKEKNFMMQTLLLDTLLALGTMALMISLVVYQIYQVRWLPYHGRQIIAMVTSIRHETGKTAWGFSRDNYYLTATWTHPRTGRTYSFWTWIMNSCPAYTKGDLVPVLIDPDNPKRYALNL
jgi:hypothetical protein